MKIFNAARNAITIRLLKMIVIKKNIGENASIFRELYNQLKNYK